MCVYVEMAPANQESPAALKVELLGEGGESGELPTESSLVFAVLEVCLCALVSQIPGLSPAPPCQGMPRHTDPTGALVASTLATLQHLPRLCSPQGQSSHLTQDSNKYPLNC